MADFDEEVGSGSVSGASSLTQIHNDDHGMQSDSGDSVDRMEHRRSARAMERTTAPGHGDDQEEQSGGMTVVVAADAETSQTAVKHEAAERLAEESSKPTQLASASATPAVAAAPAPAPASASATAASPATAVDTQPLVRADLNDEAGEEDDDFPPDSEPCQCRYLGSYDVPNSRQAGPEVCMNVISFLRQQRRRDVFRDGVSKQLALAISCRRGMMRGVPTPPRQGARGLQHPLARIVTVGDHENCVCYILGQRLGQDVVLTAYVFEFANMYAANYVASEIVRACQALMARLRAQHQDRLRRQQELQGQGHVGRQRGPGFPAEAETEAQPGARHDGQGTSESPAEEPAPTKRTEPNEFDKTLYRDHALLNELCRAPPATVTLAPVRYGKIAVVSGDGLFYDCCRNMGTCNCT